MTVAAPVEIEPAIMRGRPAPVEDHADDLDAGTRTESDLSTHSFGSSVGKAFRTVGAALADWGGRLAEGIDYFLDVPKQVFGLAKHIPLPGSEIVGNTVGMIASAMCHFMVHTPTFGALKWLKYLRRASAVSGAVNDAVGADSDVGSITVKSFLSSVSDEKLRADLEEYFTLSRSLGTIAADKNLSEAEKSDRTENVNKSLARLELLLSRRAELNELKQLAGLRDDLQKASEAQLTQLAETMADKMIKMVEGRYKDKLGMLGSKIEGDWTSLAADGERGRPLLVRRIKERLLDAYLVEREGESAKPQVDLIKKELGETFKSSSGLREAVFYTVLPIILYGPQVLNIDVGKAIHDLGQNVTEWLGNIAPHLVPQFVKDALAFAAEAAKQVWDFVWYIGGGWLALKGIQAGKALFGGGGGDAHPVDGTHVDTTHVDSSARIDGSADARPADTSHLHTDSARTADGSGLLDSVRAQADTTADTSARMQPGHADTTGAARSPIDPGARGVDPAHAPRPHADVRTGDLQGRPVDPAVRVETIRVNPR